MLANTRWEPQHFKLPDAGENSPWRVVVDTEKSGAGAVPEKGRAIDVAMLDVPGRAIVVLAGC